MFITALFTIAIRWEQLKYPSVDQWKYTYTMCMTISTYHEAFFSLKNENFDTCYNMDYIEDIILSEISQTQKYKHYMIPFK
jgi:hypothetical protein